jgi:predicted phage tail protein
MTKRRLVEVKLLGELGRRYGRSYKIMAISPKEIISALSNQLNGFKEYLALAHKNGMFFKLVSEDAIGMGYEECMMPCNRLILAPIITGSGGGTSGSIGRILLGAALIGLAFIPGIGVGLAGSAAAGKFTAAGSALFGLGGSLLFSGIANLLTPSPKQPKEGTQSFLFDRAAELAVQGLPIPLLYGEFLAVSPLVISSSISTEDMPV